VEYAKKFNPGVPQERRLIRTVQAWANVLALAEAMKRADKAGPERRGHPQTRLSIVEGLDLGLGVPPLTYTETDHRVSGRVPVYEIKDGKIALVDTIDLQAAGRKSGRRSGWAGNPVRHCIRPATGSSVEQ
jgi:branched-chain amino acid transport system substrate-binding protein